MDVQVNVGVAPERAFLHLAVGNLEIAEREPEFFEAAAGVGRGADLGLADNLEEWDPGAIQVDLRHSPGAVRQLAGVLFEVDPGQSALATAAAVLAEGDLQMASLGEGEVVLADLVVLGKVWVVVVLAIPLGEFGDLRVQRHGRLERQLEGLAIHGRERPGQAQRDGVGLRIGGQAELGTAPGEHLALGLELHVDLQADDDFVVHVCRLRPRALQQVLRGLIIAERSGAMSGRRRPRDVWRAMALLHLADHRGHRCNPSGNRHPAGRAGGISDRSIVPC